MKNYSDKYFNESGYIKTAVILVVLLLVATWFFLTKSQNHEVSQKPSSPDLTKAESEKTEPNQIVDTQEEENNSDTASDNSKKKTSNDNWIDVEEVIVTAVTPIESSEGTVADAAKSDDSRTDSKEPIFVPAPLKVPETDEPSELTEEEQQKIEVYKKRVAATKKSISEPVSYVSNVEAIGGYTANSTPPDATGAAGPNHLVAATNDSFRISTLDGTLVSSSGIKNFWTSSTNGNSISVSDVFDPRVIYDPIAQRFITAAAAQRRSSDSSVLLAVSASSDPTGTWYKWKFDHDSTNVGWADFPHLGTSADKITVSVNSFEISDDGFIGARFLIVDKDSALDGGAVTATSMKNFGNIGGSFSTALNFNNQGGNENNQYVIRTGTANIFSTGRLDLYRIFGSASSPSIQKSSNATIGVPWSISVVNAPQKGTSSLIEANDSRMANSVYRDGYVWTAHTVALSTTLRDHNAIFWWQVDVETGDLYQQGVIEDTTEDPNVRMHYYFPAIAVNKNHDVVIGYSGSSKNTYVSSYYSYRRGTDPLEYMDDPVLYKSGVGTYSGPRWGDYSASSVDPNDDLGFWTVQEHASSSNKAAISWGNVTSAVDTTQPKLTGAEILDSTHIRLTFNEALLDNATLNNPSSYTFSTSNGIALTATSANLLNNNYIDVTVNNMSSDGDYTVTLASTGITDIAGNDLDSDYLSANFTRVIPPVTVTLASINSNPTNSAINVTATIGATVSDFTESDLQLTNATVSDFSGSGSSYSFTLNPSSQGLVQVDIDADAVTDEYGTTNASGASLSRTYDSIPPTTVSFSSGVSNPTNESPFTVTANFSEPIIQLASYEIYLTGATMQTFNIGSTPTQNIDFIITPSGNGTINLSIAQFKFRDTAGNNNIEDSEVFSVVYNDGAVGTTLNTTASNPTNANIPFTVSFGASISGFNASNISVTNGSITGFSGSGTNYSFTVVPASQGTVLVTIPENSGLGYSASGQISRTFDSVSPTVTLSSTSSNPTNVSPIVVQVSTNESVSGFTQSDIVTENGNISNFTGTGANYSFSLTPSGQGVTTAEVPSSAFSDAAGNTNTVNPKLSRTFDSIAPPTPTVNISN